ncbi:MAG: Ppx/GppA family phosphatase [Spirochaetales bacterium]|nr:MAG: Ppx/GppA family phosphatase [Spirochaetales bacterium]
MNQENRNRLAAVIDIGSTAIRMMVAEIRPDNSWRVLDRIWKTLSLGRDVFVSSTISRDSLVQSLQILKGLREVLAGYKVDEQDIRIIATSAVREANNRDTFLDRVTISTGFRVSIIDGIEENRLTYMAVQHAVKDMEAVLSRSNSLIIEVGGGSTELMLLHRGKMVAAHSMNIGTVRVEEMVKGSAGKDYLSRFLLENISTRIEGLDSEMDLKRIRYFIAVGGDARFVAGLIGEPVNEWYSTVKKTDFEKFVKEIKNLSVDECVSRLNIPYDEAEGLVPSLLIYLNFMNGTSADHLIIPNVSIRDGIIISMIQGPDPAANAKFHSQVIASALGLGKKYRFDEEHAKHVAMLSLKLFNALDAEHGLDPHAQLLLEVSALLHDVGTFINPSSHHKHGEYLVSNSEIFGLTRDDIRIISNAVRYHRKSPPNPSHINYISLSREERIKVLKISALVRIADAMDKGHMQRIRNFILEKTDEEIIIRCEARGDISIERYGLPEKAIMFEDVFGLKVILG